MAVQGVAFAAKKFGIDAKIVMPVPTPGIKAACTQLALQ